MAGAESRLVKIQNKSEQLNGGCLTKSDYESLGAVCFDSIA
jgi:hypothetical protein